MSRRQVEGKDITITILKTQMCIIRMEKRKIKNEPKQMTVWFFKVEGKSAGNNTITHPFGFYVNCFISTEEEIQKARESVLNDLKADNYSVVNFEHSGRYKDFRWNEIAMQKEFDKLAKKARSNPNIVHYSSFHTWQ